MEPIPAIQLHRRFGRTWPASRRFVFTSEMMTFCSMTQSVLSNGLWRHE
jgi:hypothetical protein